LGKAACDAVLAFPFESPLGSPSRLLQRADTMSARLETGH
jgi:hypothetical protein